MSSVIISGDTSGSITLSAPAVAGTNTATLPAATGTVMVSGNMPAFSAYQSSAQTLASSTATKLQFQTEEFDTASAFDNATNYRFTPLVAGYYQINGCLQLATTNTTVYSAIYKNGTAYKIGTVAAASSAANVSAIVYLNGSTDYVELYGYFALGQNAATGIFSTWFNGAMVRSA